MFNARSRNVVVGPFGSEDMRLVGNMSLLWYAKGSAQERILCAQNIPQGSHQYMIETGL